MIIDTEIIFDNILYFGLILGFLFNPKILNITSPITVKTTFIISSIAI